MSEPRESSLADLLACIAAFGRSMQAVFDPQRFLAEFSARAQRLVAHDRVIITYLEEDGRTFTIFAEHSGKGPAVPSTTGTSRGCSQAATSSSSTLSTIRVCR